MVDRRTFIKKAAAAGALGLTAPSLAANRDYSTKAVKKICFFTKHLQWLDFDDTATVLQEAGFDGSDLTVRKGGHVVPEEVASLLPKAIRAMDKRGLRVPMVVTGVKSANDRDLDTFLGVLADNGVQHYRMGYLAYEREKSMEQNIAAFREIFARLAEKNQAHNLCGAYQNHAGTRLGASIWDLKAALEGIAPDYLGCQFDVRHAAFEGMRSWENDMLAIQGHIRTTVLKDFRWTEPLDKKWQSINVPLGQGVVDFETYFRRFAALERDDPISIHAEYPLFSTEEEQLPKTKKMELAITRLQRDLSFAQKQLQTSE